MKLAILIAAALAASAIPAYAEFGAMTKPCSVAERGHPRVAFKACTILWGMTFGHASYRVETPNGRRFDIQNHYVEGLGIDNYPPPPWFIDGKPAKETADCYENRRISICFDPSMTN
jgi:hypothetical protein